MDDTFTENGKQLHKDMKHLIEARAAAGPATTIEEQRIAWTKYSNAMSKPHPDNMVVEDRIAPEVQAELERRGHQVVVADGWSHGKVMGIRYDRKRGVILGGVAAKGNIGYGLGW